MAVKAALGLRQSPGVALSSGMRQSLHVLALSPADLAQEIAREAETNPFLRVSAPPSGPSAYDFALDTVADRPSPGEMLRRQIGAQPLQDTVRAVALYMTGALRDDGYLDATLDEIAEETGQSPELAAAALRALQSCEPAGVGARDLAECLALQLVDRGVAPGLATRAVAHLDLFVEDRWSELSHELGLPEAEVRALDVLLRELSPHPVAETGPQPAPLVPDLVVERDRGDALSVALVSGALPALSLDKALLAKVSDPKEPFVAGARSRAEALIRAVDARGATLLRIGVRLVAAQHRFFTGGPDHLRPLSRRDLAFELGLHPTTLGRAVTGKAVMAGGMLYPLTMFFPSGVAMAAGGAMSSFAVKLRIRRMVEHEVSGAPLSDAAICARLHTDGIDITRRCVAKYRGSMRIPSSFERRRHKARTGVQNAQRQ